MPRTEDFDREEILEKAKQAFWLKGFNGTSMQDLVNATGLNRSSIYNSFGSKKELYMESLKQYQRHTYSIFYKAKNQERNAIETIGLLFLYVMDEFVEDPQHKGDMIINCETEMGNQDNELRAFLESHREYLFEMFETLIVRGQTDGSIRKGEKSNLLAHYLVSAYQGFRVTGMSITDTVVLKSVIQNILKTIV